MMKMRRLLALLLVLTLLGGALTGCGMPNAVDDLIGEAEANGWLEIVETAVPSGAVAAESGEDGDLLVPAAPAETPLPEAEETALLDPDGTYTTRDDVALYIHQYGVLPGNFITKREAERLGWTGGGLETVAPGKCIGGNRFGNYEGVLPEKEGRSYTECDIDTLGASSRGAKRIVFSNDGLIFYTDDHYQTFTLLYGEVD